MISVSVSQDQLRQGSAAELDVIFTNTADVAYSNIVFRLSLPPGIRLLRGSERMEIPRIAAGENKRLPIRILADKVGQWRLSTTNFSYRDPYRGSVRVPDVCIELTVMAAAQPDDVRETYPRTKHDTNRLPGQWPQERPKLVGRRRRARILYLAANPPGTGQLRLDREWREISEALGRGKFRDRFELVPSFAVRARDISHCVMRYSPRIIHFAGHGEANGSLYAEDGSGECVSIDRDAVVGLVLPAAGEVKCVVVNACNTAKLAEALARHVDYVIGMRYKVGDTAATEFSVGFYQAIAENQSIEAAFEAGRTLLRTCNPSMREIQSPFLLTRIERVPGRSE